MLEIPKIVVVETYSSREQFMTTFYRRSTNMKQQITSYEEKQDFRQLTPIILQVVSHSISYCI